MKQKVYIDHQLVVPYPQDQAIREAVLAGKLVVAVDEGGVPMQLTPDLLKPERKG